MKKPKSKVKSFTGSLLFKTHTGYIKILICNILYCKSDGNYTIIVQEGGAAYTICRTLKTIELELKKFDFIRCHSKWLICGSKVKSFCSRSRTIIFPGINIPISRRKFDNICITLLSKDISDESPLHNCKTA
jgi:two-component system LytT family response regulator